MKLPCLKGFLGRVYFINHGEPLFGALAGCCLGLLVVSSESTVLHNPERPIHCREGIIRWVKTHCVCSNTERRAAEDNLHAREKPKNQNKKWVNVKIRHCTAVKSHLTEVWNGYE